eukprot:9226589-Prorocentrum_lima.AAC.1
MTMTMTGIMAYQFLAKKTICTTVRQRHYKTYHQGCGMTSIAVHHHNRYLHHYGNLNVQPIVGAL